MALPEIRARFSADTSEFDRGVDRVEKGLERTGREAQKTEAKVEALGREMRTTGRSSGALRHGVQNASYQMQDFIVQVQGGTAASRALSMQLPQLLSGFGALGAVVGTLAAVGVPLLASAFKNAGGGAIDFDDTLEGLIETTDRLRAIHELQSLSLVDLTEKYGTAAGAARDLLEAERGRLAVQSIAEMSAIVTELANNFGDLSGVAASAFDDFENRAAAFQEIATRQREILNEMSNLSGDARREAEAEFTALQARADAINRVGRMVADLQGEYQLAASEATQLLRAAQAFGQARGYENQAQAAANLAEAMRQTISETDLAEGEAAELYDRLLQAGFAAADLAATDMSAGIRPAIAASAQLLANLRAAVATAAAMGPAGGPAPAGAPEAPGRPQSRPMDIDFGYAGPVYGGGGGGGGGGSSGPDPRIQSLIDSLKTERETLEEWYSESQMLLEDANASQIEALGGHYEARLRLAEEYRSRLAGIEEATGEDGVTAVLRAGQDIIGAVAGNNDRLLALQKSFAAAEATVNAYRAAAQVLAEPGVPFFAKFAAVAQVVASGLALASSIRSIGQSGGGGGGASAVTSGGGGLAAQSASPMQVQLSPIDPSALYSGAQLESLFDQLNTLAGDKGYTLVGG